MYLQTLQLTHVRNLANVSIELGPGFNLFIGPNASGKTSILESLNVLALARSFRTHQITEVISSGQESLTVVARLALADNRTATAGIQKSKNKTQLRFNGVTLRSSSEIASRLPLINISPDSMTLITGGPSDRRLLLDWAMFHVEPSFLTVWKSYQRCLKQRNSALRARSSKSDVQLWDIALAKYAESINLMREKHIQAYSQLLLALCKRVFKEPVCIRYLPGWDTNTDFVQQLNERYERDIRLGYTNRGPHRADLVLTMQGSRVKTVLSRGQAKLLSAIMRIAQAHLIKQVCGICPLVLVDDLPAELDQDSRQLFLTLLAELDSQVLITSTEKGFVGEANQPEAVVFHVEHGRVLKVV